MDYGNPDQFKYSRAMGVVAFLYSLYYISITPMDPIHVLLYLSGIIAMYLLGRATLVDLIKYVWGNRK